jgi:sugar transferase (PEP-CTERM/EpsH1 system associated)
MMKKIKLAHIVLNLNTGGLERLVLDIVEKTSQPFQPIIICLKENGDLSNNIEKLGIKVLNLNKNDRFDPKSIYKLYNLLKKEKISIVHTHNFAASLYGSLSARIAGIPVVIHTEHGTHLYPQFRRRFIRKIISILIDKTVSVSDQIKQTLISQDHISKNRIMTILNGVDINKYSHKCDTEIKNKRKELNIDEKIKVIGIVARLSAEKDHENLLQAFSIVTKDIQYVNLIIIGDGILRDELEKKSKKLGLEDKVFFLGLRQDIPELLSIMDLFVLSSIREGIPLTILEAMVAGLPIVATSVGGIPEVIINEETGILVPSKNPTALANAIVRILSDSSLAQRMGSKGNERIKETFSIQRTIAEYERLYRECLIKKGIIVD